MARYSTLQVLNDTSLFDSRQLLPRSVLACTMRVWAQWLKDHLRPFPQLIREFGFGVVVVRQSIRYERPFSFFSADEFLVHCTISVRQKRHLLLGDVQFMNGDERFAHLQCAMRPLAIEHGSDLGAMPARVEGAVLDMFLPDEISNDAVERPLRKTLGALSAASAIATATRAIRICRHDSEAADQWSYIEVVANAASAREAMILEANPAERRELHAGLAAPLGGIEIEIDRPLFLFDSAEIHSTAYRIGDCLTFVHVYRSSVGGSHEHATVVERFAI
ncbi:MULTISPECIES: hypothetical protein [Burkholderia]|uniref:Uncharacterized protein n=2 Tax=Burkholderia humptydooensis TaxID=430531 RepID=A0A7U4PBU0_9BURK|nr:MULTISPECIES: hypothetical protein [Burkholderia]AGK51010.1 thioesterase-like superfamily protein [Burkholderia thailandensis MSMB121]ATF33559.1 hypothetical protein CO709_09745 [Burkholderia thailandensis]AJY39876.1 thioesterase-like superfamily protein [Burkholderia sp. 2002721687]ALX46687.1 hypothetical protein AQ610_30620 [Burkholderia humptydooensis]EIP86135.1 hypothetical protein A33K_17225 [Burkholderia humptydooensis MSMB43]